MNKPELIAFDLDDTLLRDDGTISERTLHDLHRLAWSYSLRLQTEQPLQFRESFLDASPQGDLVQ